MGHSHTEHNPKVRATSAIWGIAVGMLGVCIPLVAVTNSGLVLPVLTILAAGFSTIAIWFSPDPSRMNQQHQANQRILTLEERVSNLETICSSVDWDLQRPALPSDSAPTSKPT